MISNTPSRDPGLRRGPGAAAMQGMVWLLLVCLCASLAVLYLPESDRAVGGALSG
jgi:hypothetical protein